MFCHSVDAHALIVGKCPTRTKCQWNHRQNYGYELKEVNWLDTSAFKKMFLFHVDHPTFDELIKIIQTFLKQHDEGKARNSSRSPILVTTKVALTLHWLAAAYHFNLCFGWGISSSYFYSRRGALWPKIKAINMAFVMEFPLDDDERLVQLAAGFWQHSGGLLDVCVLALDLFSVRVRCP